jgi:hypothetical protein
MQPQIVFAEIYSQDVNSVQLDRFFFKFVIERNDVIRKVPGHFGYTR